MTSLDLFDLQRFVDAHNPAMTLFDRAAPGEVFAAALHKYFDNVPDAATLEKLH